MTTKLTLTIDDEIIKSAKSYARKKGRSLSDLVGNYLKTISAAENNTEALSPRSKRLFGAITLPDGFDYKDELEKSIKEKQGK